jgi:mannose-6-phosphate isomerase-like protein (cupin superfamily)
MEGNGYRIVSLGEIEPVRAERQEANLLPVRRELGITAFGTNAWRGDAGDRVVPPHEEDPGSEELYVVVHGRATFTIGDQEHDAPAGTLVFLEPETHRIAVAAEDGTVVLAVGGTRGEPFVVHGWDDFTVAEALRNAGRRDEARAIVDASVEANPNSWGLIYNSACWESLDGNPDAAFDLLRRAFAMDEPEVRKWAAEDTDLDPIRNDPRWTELFGEGGA